MLKNISMKFLFIMLATLYNLSAYAIEWSKAPLACLPNRAEKWLNGGIPLCHCPPQNYCNEMNIEIEPKNISFFIEWGVIQEDGLVRIDHGLELAANDIPELKNGTVPIKDIFGYTNEQLEALIHVTLFNKYGVSLKNGMASKMKITILSKNIPHIEKWTDNTLKLPLHLASRCCDNNMSCPNGTTPKNKDVTVVDPKNSEGEFIPTYSEYTLMKNNILSCHTAKDTDATQDLEFLKKYQYSSAYDIHVKNMILLLNKLSNQSPACPAVAIKDFGKLKQTLEKELERRKKTIKYTNFDTLSCSTPQTYSREGCLHGGTKITMADGTFKTIETLKLGDEVKGNHGASKIIALSKFTQKEDRMYSINGGKAFFTVEHPVLTPLGWKSVDSTVTSVKSNAKIIGTLKVGDIILMDGGKQLKVTSIKEELLKGGIDAYNLSVTGDGSFIANGFIMKSFKQMQMHY